MTKVVAAVAICLALAAGAMLGTASGHSGHPQKKLFADRWYQQVSGGNYGAWMTLSTSQLWLLCDATVQDCANKWVPPAQAAFNDWNSRSTTVDFAIAPDLNENYDVNVSIVDAVMGDPSLFGIARFFDIAYEECFVTCTIWYGWVNIGDDIHSGAWGDLQSRQATLSHELGHLLSLYHESVNASHTVHYECGQDDTGAIPVSIMAYDCIDPPSVGGSGVYQVQPWDVCGVNHAYHDPTIGYAGCEGLVPTTPTPSPTVAWSATNFSWYQSASGPSEPSQCDLTKPVPPNSPATTGLCARFTLSIPNGTYTYRSVLKRNGITISDGSFPGTNLFSGPDWQQSFGPPIDPGNYTLDIYVNGTKIGTGQVTVPSTSSPTPTPPVGSSTQTSTPRPTVTPTQTPQPTPGDGLTVAIDLNESGNTATHIGSGGPGIDSGDLQSVRNNVSGSVAIDVVVDAVPSPGLYGVGFELHYNPSLIRVTGAAGGVGNVLHMSGSPVPFEVTDSLPDTDGVFRFDSVDLSGNEETGAGVLAHLQVECIGTGTASLTLSDSSTGGGNSLGLLGDSGQIVYNIDQEIEASIGCNTVAGPTPTVAPTPTRTSPSTPPPNQRAWGDGNCDGSVNPIDGLATLRFDAGLSVSKPPSCPNFGTLVMAGGAPRMWGDSNCDGSVDPVDGLALLRYDAGLNVVQQTGCPTIGVQTTISSALAPASRP